MAIEDKEPDKKESFLYQIQYIMACLQVRCSVYVLIAQFDAL